MHLQILLLEDDPEDFFLIRDALDQLMEMEISLRWERDYQGGLRALASDAFDICLVDYMIGGASGVDFVHDLSAAGYTIPTIILTGATESSVDLAAQKAGAAHYLEKTGLTASRLERTIRYVAHHAGKLAMHREAGGATSVDSDRLRAGLETPRIALIDDDEDDYLIAREYLIDVFGGTLQLDWARCWSEGADLVAKKEHDVYIVDYRLGQHNGLDLVREATALGATAPFIVLTGEASREIDLEAMHVGATDYLVKSEITAHLLDRSVRYAMERFRSERRLSELAQIDQLTGLANRARFREFLERSLAQGDRDEAGFALMLIDLDRFKSVNDTFGHAAGDMLLHEIGRRLRACVRSNDLVARLGGDEFTIVLIGINDEEALSHKAEQLSRAIAHPIKIGTCTVEVGCSIGIGRYSSDAETIDELIIRADTAMYCAKQSSLGEFRFYTEEMRHSSARLLDIESGLRNAIDLDQFTLVYQPQASIRTGRLVGFEALLRWSSPDLGQVSPAEFIPIAEESNTILAISEWVLSTTCRQLRIWRDNGLPDMHVAVNFSARQFLDPDLAVHVARILAEYELPHDLLEIEITESDILQNSAEVLDLLRKFSEIGIRVALDDFGTGYSSLNHLRSFPGTVIKIDQSFVSNINSTNSDPAIVRSLITMAHNLGLKVVAEGVECRDQLQLLGDYDCDVVQGFLVSPPLSADRIPISMFHEAFFSGIARDTDEKLACTD